MNLLDKESHTDLKFKIISKHLVIGDENTLNNINEEIDVLKLDTKIRSDVKNIENKLPFRINEVYSINELLSMNFGEQCNDFNFIRLLLFRNGLMNDYDKSYLLSIGFDEKDLFRTVDTLGFKVGISNLLRRRGITYLWQILIFSRESLLEAYQIGEKVVEKVENTINSLGYSLRITRKVQSVESESLPECQEIMDNINKILNSRKVYNKKLHRQFDEIQKTINQIDESDELLNNEIIKLNRLLKKDNK